MGVLIRKEFRRENGKNICPLCIKVKEGSDMWRREGTRVLKYQILIKRFRNVDA
jgi:hypothetical protein